VIGDPGIPTVAVRASLARPPTSTNCMLFIRSVVPAAITSVGPGRLMLPIPSTATTLCIEPQ
jgi:hypothetical protein